MDTEKKCTHIYNGIWLSHKKWNLAICNNRDAPRGYYVKWNKSDREKQILLLFHLYVESKETKQMNKLNKIETDLWETKNRLMVDRWERVGGLVKKKSEGN